MKTNMDVVNLTDDPLKNILIMAPLLDEAGQNRVFGLMCGLIVGCSDKAKNEHRPEMAAG